MKANNGLIRYLKAREQDMFALLGKMVGVQSGSHNKEGVDQVARLIKSMFQANTVSCQMITQKKFGSHLVVRSRCEKRFDKQVLLVGHMDTVFPKDTDFNWYREDSTKSYGPGVIDMKGGLVAGIFALKAIDNEKLLTEIPITFIFNSDEEIGSPTSKQLIQKEAKNSAFAFVLEAGGLDGEVVTGRKGNISLELTVRGEAGHAAFAGRNKASAILELAHKIILFEGLNDPDKGITVNVGLVDGGISRNTVPDQAKAGIDFRFSDTPDEAFLEERIFRITQKQTVSRTKSDFVVLSRRPPMFSSVNNKKLFKAIREAASSLGLSVKEEFRAGVSDANSIAGENIPVVDGMGVIGANDHSENEYMIKKSLLERSTLLAYAIISCWGKHKKNILL